jgi:hypothetical protein
MANEHESTKERLRALLNFPELMISDYSQDPYAEERVGAALIGHTQEGRLAQPVFRKFHTRH